MEGQVKETGVNVEGVNYYRWRGACGRVEGEVDRGEAKGYDLGGVRNGG